MKNFSVITGLVLNSLFCPAVAYPRQARLHLSPDGMLLARVTAVSRKCLGSRFEIRRKGGPSILQVSYGSQDCEHGMGITGRAWTSDSMFFVFNTNMSGGHQPWHWPVYFYSRRDNKIYSLDKSLGPIIAPEIELKPPHLVKTRVLEQGNDAGRLIMVDLNQNRRPKRP
jgi:hypothetical protein